MSWNIHEIQRKTKSYVALKKNERVGKKVKSSYIYLGPTRNAMKIFADLQIKPLIDEKEISYSGEIILGKIANSINFSKVMEKYTGDKRIAEILTNIIILRTLFSDSKRKLVKERLSHSILKDSTDLRYLEEVYRFMDCIHDNLGDIMYDVIKNAVKKHSLDMEYLIIDATRIKVWKDEETGMIRFGYSSKKDRKNLPQVNLILGMNNQQIPLFANMYPGNTQDIKMFHDFICNINTKYLELTKNVKEKIIIFDQGNVNKGNIGYLGDLRKQGIHYITMMKTNSAAKFIKKVDKSTMPLIYTKEKSQNVRTEIYGELIEGKVYGNKSKVLVCYNPYLMKQKCEIQDRKVDSVKQMVVDGRSLEEIKERISKYNLKRALKLIENDGRMELEIDINDLDARKTRYGFFVLFTNHPDMVAEKILEIYKSRNIVEEGFRALKSDLEINPTYHSKDMRIETHVILVVFGYLLLSLLRVILKEKDMRYSFEHLKETIVSGNAVEGFYENEQLKNRLYLWRPIKPRKELEEIFRALKIKTPKFDVKEVIPTKFDDF
jgi:transposase